MRMMESPKPAADADVSAIAATNFFGTPDVASWQRTLADDQIEFVGLLANAAPMTFQNRPTFHQVVELARSGREPKPAANSSSTSKPDVRDRRSENSESESDFETWQLLLLAAGSAAVLASGVMTARKLRNRTRP